jgi:hypothetical protein
MKLVKTTSRESGTTYTEFTDGENTFIYEDDVLVRVTTVSFDAVISNSDNSLVEFKESEGKEGTIKHKLVCLLEELNDILHEGRLESEKDIDKIVYECKRLIDITE